MSKYIAGVFLAALSLVAHAHEDRYFKISKNGDIPEIPAPWGPVQVLIQYQSSSHISSVRLTGKNFSTLLAPCVLKHLDHVIKVEALGSWWHDPSIMPPYVSLEFVEKSSSSPELPPVASISVTFSLVNGQILMAQQWQDPWWGSPRGHALRNARSCSEWNSL